MNEFAKNMVRIALLLSTLTAGNNVYAIASFECKVDFSGKFINGNYGIIEEGTSFKGSLLLEGTNTSDEFPDIPEIGEYKTIREKSVVNLDIDQHPNLEFEISAVRVRRGELGHRYSGISLSPVKSSPPIKIGGINQDSGGALIIKMQTDDPNFLATDDFPVTVRWNDFETASMQLGRGSRSLMVIDKFDESCKLVSETKYCGELASALNIKSKDIPEVEFTDRTQYGCHYTSDNVHGTSNTITLRANCPSGQTLLYSGFYNGRPDDRLVGSSTSETLEGLQYAEYIFWSDQDDPQLDVETYAYCEN